jgi:hypothetical protein
MAIHPDYIDKDRTVPLVLDGQWHDLGFKVGGVILPYVRPAFGTYLVVYALLGAVDSANHPTTDLAVKVTRWTPGATAAAPLVYDAVDNGTAWDYIEMVHLVTPTWAGSRTAKFVASATYPGMGVAYRGRGGAADVQQRLLKFLLQRSS